MIISFSGQWLVAFSKELGVGNFWALRADLYITFERIEPDPVEWQEFDKARDSIEKEYGTHKVWEFMRLYDRLMKAIENPGRTAGKLYYDTAGEIEARDTANRAELTAEERKNTRPDIDRTDVVFAEDSGESYSIGYTDKNEPVAIVEEDVLKGVPKANWVNTIKKLIKKKFNKGVPVSGKLIKVNKISRDEYVKSEYSKYLKNTDKTVYKDKFNVANNLNDIILASTNYVNEDLNHDRNDNIKEFARGNVYIRVGNSDYKADVIIGLTNGNNMLLYDIINFEKTSLNIKRRTSRSAMQNAGSQRNEMSSKNSITTTSENVKENPEKAENSNKKDAFRYQTRDTSFAREIKKEQRINCSGKRYRGSY